MARLQLIATSAMGLEAVVARELKQLGYEDVRIDNGRVFFTGDYIDICRCNLWLRSSDRVLVNMGEFLQPHSMNYLKAPKPCRGRSGFPQTVNFRLKGDLRNHN